MPLRFFAAIAGTITRKPTSNVPTIWIPIGNDDGYEEKIEQVCSCHVDAFGNGEVLGNHGQDQFVIDYFCEDYGCYDIRLRLPCAK